MPETDEESAWEPESGESAEESEYLNEGDDATAPAKKPKAAEPAAKKRPEGDDIQCISRRPKKLRRQVITEEEIQAESSIPSYQRLTVNGGYAATAAHRKKIAMANAGNVPWNKGKHRSQEDKDKIKAAVKERNRRQLLVNLAAVGLSEEEHTSLRKRIKIMRETLRKAKINVKKQQEVRANKLAQEGTREKSEKQEEEEEDGDDSDSDDEEELVATSNHPTPIIGPPLATAATETEPSTMATKPLEETAQPSNANASVPIDGEATTGGPLPELRTPTSPAVDAAALARPAPVPDTTVDAVASPGHQGQQVNEVVALQASGANDAGAPATATLRESVGHTQASDAPTNGKPAAASSAEEREYDIEHVPEMFRRDFEWTPHPMYGSGEEPCGAKCPEGGPGGFLCCDHCSSSYSDYLSKTFQELEDQKTNKVAAELESIQGFLELNYERLNKSVAAAQRKPPPTALKET